MEELQNLMNWKMELHVTTTAPHVSASSVSPAIVQSTPPLHSYSLSKILQCYTTSKALIAVAIATATRYSDIDL